MNQKIITQDQQKIIDELGLKEKFENSKILISGCAGFIGSWLTETLCHIGAQVTGIDNFATGRLENLELIKKSKEFQFVDEDISKFESKESFDFIFHFASRASPEEYSIHPIETLDANSNGTKNLLKIAKENNSRLLYASTSEIYGDATIIPTPESYWGNVNPTGIRSCYDEAKRFGEAMCMAYYREHDLDFCGVRIFNTYGPRIRFDGIYGRALPRFCLQALNNEPLTIYGDGKQTRSFSYITDTLTGIIKCMLTKSTKGNFVNIGNTKEITILELAEKIIEVTNSKSQIEFKAAAEDDPRRRCADITKAKELLEWEPKILLEDGLRKFIGWYSSD